MRRAHEKEADMPLRLDPRPVRLNRGQLLRIRDGAGVTVACLAGAAWVTQADDFRDIVLEAGESFVLDRPGLALVNAAGGPCELSFEPARSSQSVPSACAA
jgi:hypothetical protein